ncbi:MAG: hypothetical protein ABJE95_08530 [Byssovorax sp.]
MRLARAIVAASVILAACSPAAPIAAPVSAPPAPPPPLAVSAPPAMAIAPPTPAEIELLRKVRAMITRVSRARGLPALREVPIKVLNREQILAKIKLHVDDDVPKESIVDEGEALAALELVPSAYDFLEGSYKLIQGRIAGFYEPEDRTMYLVDDLDDDEAEETLAHELDHALQDQTYPLAPMMKYAPSQADRLGAAHALVEGDAMSAMYDVVAGSAFNVSDTLFQGLATASTALSAEGSAAPYVLQASLIAPYSDGFSFVQALRIRGGWPAVDAAWRALPDTTEQLLHIEKYEAREPAIAVAIPATDALGAGFRATLDDVMGEQSLRIAVEAWAGRSVAVAAAAGWGGDRYVVARRDVGAKHEIALAWHLVFDAVTDADEMAAVLEKRFGKACRERELLGPISWARRGRELAITGGPFERSAAGAPPKSAGTCKAHAGWARALVASATP